MRFKAEKADVKLVFQNKEDVKIYGNKTRFSQLIGNLVLNAIEAYEHKKQKSTEKEVAVNFYQKKDFVILTVKDSASGMSDQTINKIFKPFFSTKENSGNTGIGLTMCKDIVESEFMGKIDVKSELGKGTEFKISLPQPEVS
jgi:signal transduction histidine kinase